MKLPRLGKKGQEEAPFALFLAAVMLALLIPIVGELYKTSQAALCEEQIQSSMETLAREVEIATSLSGTNVPVNVNFNYYTCGDRLVSNFTIKQPTSEECVESCATGSCRIIVGNGYTGEQPTMIGEPVCIRTAWGVDLQTTGCPSGYNNVPAQTFEPKVYTLVMLKEVGGGLTTVRICEMP